MSANFDDCPNDYPNEYPSGLTEDDLLNFLYLQACYMLGRKPQGHFTGDAAICAEVMDQGGDINGMRRAGARPSYALGTVSRRTHNPADDGIHKVFCASIRVQLTRHPVRKIRLHGCVVSSAGYPLIAVQLRNLPRYNPFNQVSKTIIYR